MIEKVLGRLAKEYHKERIYRLRFGFKHEVYLFTAENIEAVLSKSSLIDKSVDYDILKKWLGNSLLTSSGNEWRQRRKILTPTFHFKILEDFIPLINEHSIVLCNKLIAKSDDEDISSYLSSCTLDIIMETAMGVKLNAQTQEDVPYVTALHRFGEIFAERSTAPWMWYPILFDNSRIGKEFYAQIKILHEFTRSVVRKRKEELIGPKNGLSDPENRSNGLYGDLNAQKKQRLALLDLLLEMHLNDPKSLSEEAIREEVDTFTFGGHDTTGIALTYSLFLIGHHEAVQARILTELKEVLGLKMNRLQ